MERIRKLFLVHADETGDVLYFLLFFMIIGAGMAIGRSTADALFFKRFGIEYLPLMYIIQSVLLAAASTLYAAFADRVPAESFFKALMGILAVLVGGSWMVIASTGSTFIYPAYYLVYEVSSDLLLVHGALYMNQNMNTLQAKRLSPLIFAGAQVGTISGGLTLAVFAQVIGTQNLVLAWCLLLGLGIAVIYRHHRRHGVSKHFRPPGKSRHPVREGIVDVKQGIRFSYNSDLLRAASFALFFMVIAFYVLSYSVNRVYTRTFATVEALTSFFGGLTAATSIIALLVQLFVTNRTIQRFGVRKVNLLFPLTTVFSLLALVFSFALPSALLGSFNKDTLMPAFRNPVRAMFFNVLPGYMQGRARAMSVAIVLPLALLSCGILLWFMQRMEDPPYFLLPGAGAAILYFIFNRRMNRAYVSTLLTTLKDRLFLPNEKMYAELQGSSEDVLKEVMRGVSHEDSEVSVAFARLLVDSFPDKAVDQILTHLGKKDAPTVDRMLRMLGSHDISPYRAQLHALAARGDEHLRATVLSMLIKDGDEQASSEAIRLLDSDNPRLRCIGIRVALQHQRRDDAGQHWLDLLGSGTDSRLAAMDLVADIVTLDDARLGPIIAAYRQALVTLLQEPAADIRTRALEGISRWPDTYHIDLDELLADPLDSEDPALRAAAAGCLHLVTADDRDRRIARALGDGHPRVRKAALQSLQKVHTDFLETAMHWITDNRGNPRAQGVLLSALQDMELPASLYKTIANRKVDEAGRLQTAVAVLEDTPVRAGDSTTLELVRYTLKERMEQTLLLALQALEPLHEPGIISIIRAGFSSGDSRHVSNACEVLANLDNRKVANRLYDILQHSINKQASKHAAAEFKTAPEVLEWCQQQKDDWLQRCAHRALTTLAQGNANA